MNTQQSNGDTWVRPELVRLGQIADVSGVPTGSVQVGSSGNTCPPSTNCNRS